MTALTPLLQAGVHGLSHVATCGNSECSEGVIVRGIADLVVTAYGMTEVANEACSALTSIIKYVAGEHGSVDADGYFKIFEVDGHWGYVITDEDLRRQPGVESALRIYVTHRNMISDLKESPIVEDFRNSVAEAGRAGDPALLYEAVIEGLEDFDEDGLMRIGSSWWTLVKSIPEQDQCDVVCALLGLIYQIGLKAQVPQ